MVALVVLLVSDSVLIQFKALGFLVTFLFYGILHEMGQLSERQNELYEKIADMEEKNSKPVTPEIEVVEEQK